MPNHSQDSLGSNFTQGDEDSPFGPRWALVFGLVQLCYYGVCAYILWLNHNVTDNLEKITSRKLYNEAEQALKKLDSMKNTEPDSFYFRYLCKFNSAFFMKLKAVKNNFEELNSSRLNKEDLELCRRAQHLAQDWITAVKKVPQVLYNETEQRIAVFEDIKRDYNTLVNKPVKLNPKYFSEIDNYCKEWQSWVEEHPVNVALLTPDRIQLCLDIQKAVLTLIAKIKAGSDPFVNHARLSQNSSQPAVPTGILTDAAPALSAESNISRSRI